MVACRIFQPRSMRDFVVERQRPDRHAGHARGVLDHRRRHALHQHQVAFADVVGDAAVGEEAAAIVDDDRRLLDRAHEVDRGRQRLRPRLLAHDDLDQHHLVDRREEMHADEILRLLRDLGQRGDRQRRGVGGEDDVRAHRRLRPLRRLRLDGAILEHGLDHEVAALQRRIIGGRGDAREQRVAVGAPWRGPWRSARRSASPNAPCPCRRSPGRDRSARRRARRWR